MPCVISLAPDPCLSTEPQILSLLTNHKQSGPEFCWPLAGARRCSEKLLFLTPHALVRVCHMAGTLWSSLQTTVVCPDHLLGLSSPRAPGACLLPRALHLRSQRGGGLPPLSTLLSRGRLVASFLLILGTHKAAVMELSVRSACAC